MDIKNPYHCHIGFTEDLGRGLEVFTCYCGYQTLDQRPYKLTLLEKIKDKLFGAKTIDFTDKKIS